MEPRDLCKGSCTIERSGQAAAKARNPDIASTFFRAGLIEAWGRGYERIVAACRDAGTPAHRRVRRQQRLAEVGVNPTKGSEPIRPQVESQLESQLESQVLAALVAAPLGKAAVARALGQRQPSGPLHTTIRRLVEEAAVELTLPDKPNSRLQKYRITTAGKARLAAIGRYAITAGPDVTPAMKHRVRMIQLFEVFE